MPCKVCERFFCLCYERPPKPKPPPKRRARRSVKVLPGPPVQSTVQALLSMAEVARVLQCQRQAVWYLIRRGAIPARKVGGHWVVSLNDIARVEFKFGHGRMRRPGGYTTAMRESGYRGRRKRRKPLADA